MCSNGIPFEEPFISDGKIHRFSIDSKKRDKDEWYVVYSGEFKETPYFICIYGSWSTGFKGEYNSWKEDQGRRYTEAENR